jgi:hypothetical protein
MDWKLPQKRDWIGQQLLAGIEGVNNRRQTLF